MYYFVLPSLRKQIMGPRPTWQDCSRNYSSLRSIQEIDGIIFEKGEKRNTKIFTAIHLDFAPINHNTSAFGQCLTAFCSRLSSDSLGK